MHIVPLIFFPIQSRLRCYIADAQTYPGRLCNYLDQCQRNSNSPPGNEYRVQPVEVPGKVPEAGLPAEPSVDEHVESVDAKERRVPLSAREDVDGRVAEPDVAHDVRGRKRLLNGLRGQEGGNIGEEGVDGGGGHRGNHLGSVQLDLE
jgi:hypothetical protein